MRVLRVQASGFGFRAHGGLGVRRSFLNLGD